MLLLSVASCRPVVLPEPPSPLSQVSQSYRAQADGIITLGEDLEVPGRVRLDYLVHPNNSVEATQLSVWIDDVDLIVELSWWKDRLELVVAEGLPDFLLSATRFSDSREHAPAVIGVISGSWTRELESRIPDATRIALRFHRDEAGRKYASQVSPELRARCEVAEWKT